MFFYVEMVLCFLDIKIVIQTVFKRPSLREEKKHIK